MKAKRLVYLLYLLIAVLPYGGLYYLHEWYERGIRDKEEANVVIVSKEDMSLSVYGYSGELRFSAPVACGKNYGNKEEEGDMKTPEGVFRVSEIVNSTTWKHDFKDGNGEIENAYGPYFIRLAVPNHKGIGIHGTHNAESIGHRETEGCIRLRNDDLRALVPLVKCGTVVVVIPSGMDVAKTKNKKMKCKE